MDLYHWWFYTRMLVVHRNSKHDFDVACHYFVLGVLEWCLALVLGEMCAGIDSRSCKSRPSGSISPKWELQSLTLSSDSWFSPRRPRRGLSDMVSRSGERHSPKQGREENLRVWARYLIQARGFGVLSDWHSRLGESGSPKRVREVLSCVCGWILV